MRRRDLAFSIWFLGTKLGTSAIDLYFWFLLKYNRANLLARELTDDKLPSNRGFSRGWVVGSSAFLGKSEAELTCLVMAGLDKIRLVSVATALDEIIVKPF